MLSTAAAAPPTRAPFRPARSVWTHRRYRFQQAQRARAAAADVTTEAGVVRFQPLEVDRVEARDGQPPLVLLAGFGNCSEDYTAPFGDEPASIAAALQRRGFRCYVLPIERKDWLKVARALWTAAYWRGASTTHPGYSWYLERVHDLVERARRETGSEQVDLVGHSAGGWLARAFLGGADYRPGGPNASADTLGSADLEPHPAVRTLVTLGTPHTPPPADKVRDQTGGALSWVDKTWPGAFFAGQGVNYVAVAGRVVRGDRDADRRTLSGYAAGSYAQVCGEHNVVGDAVVPLQSALLEGAEHITLDGVFHSMSRVRTFNEPSGLPWYGDDAVVDVWLQTLVRTAK